MDNSKNIPVQVRNRVAWTGWGGYIICGNTDYTVTFTFDEEWGEATAKTARFKFRTDEGMKYTDQPFTGNTVAVPMLSNIREVEVGVYVGDLNTTTGATIRCVPSILCGSGEQSEYEKKRFDELMQLFNDTLHGHENLKTLADFYCMASELRSDDGLTILPDVVGVDRVSFRGNYLRYCGDGGVVKSVEEIEREGTKYLRLRFDMGPLVTNFDVPEFIDIPVALVTERVEEVPGPGLVTNSTGLELDLGVGSGGGGGLTPEQLAQLESNTFNIQQLQAWHAMFDPSVYVTNEMFNMLAQGLQDVLDEHNTYVFNELTAINARIDGIEGGINEIEAMIDESGVLD